MLRSEFSWAGLAGEVRVEVVANIDPAALGCPPSAADFPVCMATIDYPPRGYRSLFGWVQLVRSTDNDSAGTRFEMDPFALFGDAPSPYCWYGTAPILFDAPWRPIRVPLHWTAYSFLATTPLEEVLRGAPRMVVPLYGFSWGFDITDDVVRLHDVVALDPDAWMAQLEVLRASYPYWHFADASSAHPPSW